MEKCEVTVGVVSLREPTTSISPCVLINLETGNRLDNLQHSAGWRTGELFRKKLHIYDFQKALSHPRSYFYPQSHTADNGVGPGMHFVSVTY